MGEHIGISEHRMKHIVAVAEECKRLAEEEYKLTPLDVMKAYVIGFNHDIGYAFSDETWQHPIIGCNMLRYAFGKDVPAIRFHGKPSVDRTVFQDILNKADLTINSRGVKIPMDIRVAEIKKVYGENSSQYKNAFELSNIYKKEEQEIVNMESVKVQIKYFSNRILKLDKIEKGDWIDLRVAEDVTLKKGEFKLIHLGVGMKLPEGYEAHIVPRSSTFKNFGIIQTNHMGVIDNSYCGNEDEWLCPVYALRDTEIHLNDRICQFRIMENQPKIIFDVVENLCDDDRNGFGSTGTN